MMNTLCDPGAPTRAQVSTSVPGRGAKGNGFLAWEDTGSDMWTVQDGTESGTNLQHTHIYILQSA